MALVPTFPSCLPTSSYATRSLHGTRCHTSVWLGLGLVVMRAVVWRVTERAVQLMERALRGDRSCLARTMACKPRSAAPRLPRDVNSSLPTQIRD